MDNVFQAIKETTYEEAHHHYPIPYFLEEIVDLFGKVHLYYRAIKNHRLFKQAEAEGRGHPAVYGAALHLASDYTRLGSYAIKVALVAKCAEDLLHQYQQLHSSYRQLNDFLFQRFPIYHPIQVRPDSQKTPYLSPSFRLFIDIEVMGFLQRLLKVFSCALQVLKEAFQMSMCLRDTYLLANGDPQAKFDACTELIGDWERYLNQLGDNQAWLREEIAKRRKLADRILTKLEARYPTTVILSRLQDAAQQTAQVAIDNWAPIQQAIFRTVDTILPNGKIAEPRINFGQGLQFIPALPPARYPPWAGQAIHLPSTPSADMPEGPILRIMGQFTNFMKRAEEWLDAHTQ
ncbi:hypothetical protein PNK_2061 [Candidatus Protochlamydia naegleriophila]|uniref:Uncharacterized protein n=1 Tax=Candidatus Protochlamydia naegleriophila TaxID=389348 RepID=A0A0U5ETY9_9BACT|nr:hypothetical protein [Candidatus Protochlamydia naegleriophila]CUI17665.1 hypothetical protein PNK_2061 [Candidatus Protochlamydia naegleriophila]